MMEDLGHTVVSASSAREALVQLESLGFDLMITDHAMPVMTGTQLIVEARARHPRLPVILASRLCRAAFAAASLRDAKGRVTAIGPRPHAALRLSFQHLLRQLRERRQIHLFRWNVDHVVRWHPAGGPRIAGRGLRYGVR